MPGDALASVVLSSSALEDGFYAVGVMLVGVAVILYSYDRHRERRLMRDTATSEVGSMAVGAVELTGTADPADGSVPAMLTEEDCVVVDYEVEEYRWTDDGKEWRTVDSGVVAEPFYVDDGTGRVLVDPSADSSAYDISDANRLQIECGEDVRPDESVVAFLRRFTDEPAESGQQRRFTQEVIPVGDDVFVYGDAALAADASATAATGDVAVDVSLDGATISDGEGAGVAPAEDAVDLIVTEDDDTRLFLVSDKTEARLTADRKYSLLVGGLGGVVVFSVGLWWFLNVLGV